MPGCQAAGPPVPGQIPAQEGRSRADAGSSTRSVRWPNHGKGCGGIPRSNRRQSHHAGLSCRRAPVRRSDRHSSSSRDQNPPRRSSLPCRASRPSRCGSDRAPDRCRHSWPEPRAHRARKTWKRPSCHSVEGPGQMCRGRRACPPATTAPLPTWIHLHRAPPAGRGQPPADTSPPRGDRPMHP